MALNLQRIPADDSDSKSSTAETNETEEFKKSILKSWSVNVNSDLTNEEDFDEKDRSRFIFYGNTQIYLLVRIFSILYERLLRSRKLIKKLLLTSKTEVPTGSLILCF